MDTVRMPKPPSRPRSIRLSFLATTAALVLAAPLAHALLTAGSAPKDFAVADPDDKPARLSTLRGGKPALVFYEDKDGGAQNDRFKQRLGKLRSASPAAQKVKLIAVADVGDYNYWPAKGYVKDALRASGKKAGLTVWADWSTDGRKSLAAHAAQSNLVLLDAAGKVLWSSAGALTPAQENDLLARVEAAGK